MLLLAIIEQNDTLKFRMENSAGKIVSVRIEAEDYSPDLRITTSDDTGEIDFATVCTTGD